MTDEVSLASQRWLASMADRQRRGKSRLNSLPPWLEMGWFQPIKETQFISAGIGDEIQVCTTDPMRVLIMMAAPPGQNMFASTLRNNGLNAGIQVQATTLPLVITQAEYGLMCNVEWFVTTPVVMNFQVWEVLLRDWPQ